MCEGVMDASAVQVAVTADIREQTRRLVHSITYQMLSHY